MRLRTQWLIALAVLGAACAQGVGTGPEHGGSTGNGGAGPATSTGSSTSAVGGMATTTASSTMAATTAASSTTAAATTATTSTSTSVASSSAATSTVATSAASTTSTTASSTSSSSATSGSGGCSPVNVVTDGGLELGPGGGAWVESSTNYGTPICDTANCGTGGGSGPYAGTYWAWFGGYNLGTETATLQQSITIPNATSATLDFQLEIPACDSQFDYFEVTIDGQQVYYVDGSSSQCGSQGYQLKSVNVSQFADGQVHSLQLAGYTYAYLLTSTNFMVDEVELTVCI